MSVQVKSFLSTEGKRNRANAALYEDILNLAYPGQKIAVIIGHHICFEFDGDISTENEIPAADTLLFDHEIMGRVFGRDKSLALMQNLVALNADKREEFLRTEVDRVKKSERLLSADWWQEAPQYDGPTSYDV